jgi:hypothetical protein
MSKMRVTLLFSTLLFLWGGLDAGFAHDPVDDMLTAQEAPVTLQASAPFSQKQTDGNAVGLVISNYGFFGNNFVTRRPSMEYPLGTEIDHLIRAGFWVGAINADGDTVVSSGAISGYWGTSTAQATEFTPRQPMKERSILITSRSYSKDAISEQDFLTSFTDYPLRGSNDNKLDISVRQESFLWSYRFAEAFIIISFTVRNDGDGSLRKPCIGLFAELSSGWKGGYDTWRPSGSSWFRKKMLEYFPEFRMVGEHHHTFDNGNAPSWGAISLLGARVDTIPVDLDPITTFRWWDWYWERDNPMEDPDRYVMMSAQIADPVGEILPNRDDPVELIAAGPFPELAAGDSITFVCAFLGGMDRAALLQNAEWAQRAYDNDYVLPSPPQPSRFRIKPASEEITIYWDDTFEDSLDPFYQVPDFEGYRVYVTQKEGATSEEFNLVREVDIVDGIGYDTGFESVRDSVWFGDTLYTYNTRVDNLKDGFKYWVALTSFDRGMPEQGVESMESGVLATRVLVVPGTAPAEEDGAVIVFPNPYRGEAAWDGARDREKYMWFANLPAKATIRIYTLAGDLVKTIEFDGATYDGSDIQGLGTFSERHVALPGGIYAWDLITNKDQAVASGLYMYSVENKETGSNHIGKFMIIR